MERATEGAPWRPWAGSDGPDGPGHAAAQHAGSAAPWRRQQQRARSWHAVDSLADLLVPLSPLKAVEHAVQQACELLRLAFVLSTYVGLGWKWMVQFLRLCAYAVLLLPGFLRMLHFYFFSPLVRRDEPYGRQPRQLLDLYVPPGAGPGEPPVPVVVFVTGGAWTIGYKAWGATLAQRLCEAGVLVACLDYRNFPQGSATEMLEDVNTGVAWVVRHAARLGGDPDGVFLVGQSAGAQLALLALLGQAEQAARGEAVAHASPVWQPQDVRGFIGVSGAYDLEGLAEHLHRRGLYRGMLDAIMALDGRPAYARLSPLAVARRLASDSGADGWAAGRGPMTGGRGAGNAAACGGGGGVGGERGGGGAWCDGEAAGAGDAAGGGAGRFLPPVVLLHGTADKTVPHASSELMHGALKVLRVPCFLKLFPGKTHTDFLLEDAFRGGEDVLTAAILEAVTGKHPGRLCYPAACPGPLVSLASAVCPF